MSSRKTCAPQHYQEASIETWTLPFPSERTAKNYEDFMCTSLNEQSWMNALMEEIFKIL